MVKRWDFDRTIKCSCFAIPGGAEEYYFAFTNHEAGSFDKAIEGLCEKYQFVTGYLGLSEQTLLFSRLHVSDIVNQKNQLAKSELFRHIGHGAVSVIEQTPLTRDSLVLFSYHVRKRTGEIRKEFLDNGRELPWTGMVARGDNYSMVWSSNRVEAGHFDSRKQTDLIFKSFSALLDRYDLSVRKNLVRTWIYVRDIDNHYAGMVEARKDFFRSQGLSAQSRFVASTGIEGRGAEAGAIVSMDSLSIGNIEQEQIDTMDALEHLPRTTLYGVTFERGLRVRFGDRSHLVISGTASIDEKGNVSHEGDIGKQTHRTIDNAEALLRGQGAALSDMTYALCYLRNPKDYECVKEIVTARLPENIPLIIVEAAVCRPAWLFEMEGTAIIADTNPFPPFM
jgi:enamine deaminase RidA (YjgF/YER057c/UK114 family)